MDNLTILRCTLSGLQWRRIFLLHCESEQRVAWVFIISWQLSLTPGPQDNAVVTCVFKRIVGYVVASTSNFKNFHLNGTCLRANLCRLLSRIKLHWLILLYLLS